MKTIILSAAFTAILATPNVFAQPTVTTLAGGTSGSYYGYENTDSLYSLFHTPMGIAVDQSGDLFVADYENNAIRELTTPLATGYTITWATNKIDAPVGVALDANGNVFVLNRGSTKAVSTNGTVLEFNQYGILIATNATQLTNAAAIALDNQDNIYVTARTNLLIEITPTNQITIATVTQSNALLSGIAVIPDSAPNGGDFAVCDANRDGIYTITPSGIITTNAGFNGRGDGTGPDNIGITNSLAQFAEPSGLAVAGDGSLIVCDYGNDRVKVVTSTGITTNLYGVSSNDWVSPVPGWLDGTVAVPDALGGVAGRCPEGVALSSDGSTVYTTEDYYDIIRETTGGNFQAVPPPPPTAPTGLTATIITNDIGAIEVVLNWSANNSSSGVTNYLLDRSTSANAYSFYTNTGTATTYTDTNLAEGTTYYYAVQAENAGGESPVSSSVSVTISLPPPPAAPTGLTATVVTNGDEFEVVLNWNANNSSSGVTNYLVDRSTSTNTYPFYADTKTATAYTDTNVTDGNTYYYVVQAENAGGESVASAPVSVSIPVPPPGAPIIGWYDFEGSLDTGFYSTNHPVSGADAYIANNPINIAIVPTENGVTTKYITIPPYTNGTPVTTIINNGATPLPYENGQLQGSAEVNPLPALTLSNGLVTIEAVNVNGLGEASSVSSASFEFEAGTPSISAPNDNAAQFTVSDVTSNVVFYYTLDGSDPTNAPLSQQVVTTNGTMTLSLDGTTNIFFQVRALGYGLTAGYLMSGIAQQFFSSSSFTPTTISWGFAQGECSSAFVGAAGQTFYAPVTLTTVPGTAMYSLQFNMTLWNSGAGITNPGPPTETFDFNSFLQEPIPGTTPPIMEVIPPLMYADDSTNSGDYVTQPYNGSTNFINLTISNGNELAVGWVERYEETNLYNTLDQTLITYSQAHDDTFPNAALGEPNGVIVGGYGFQIPTNAVNGQQYQIRLNQPSATDNGIGNPGSEVFIFAGTETNSGALGPGTLNAIKNVTVGSAPYLVGNVYPFNWFNAGDFGNSNLQSADIEQVFQSAVYGFNTPPTNSDFYDAMDSCGDLGIMDTNPADEFYGYYTNAGPLTAAERADLYAGDTSVINQMAFGDRQLDISDVYLTFLRSEFTNDYVWFQRFWTNGVRVATATYAPGVIPSVQTRLSSSIKSNLSASTSALASITNTPYINFTTTDFLASANQTLQVPINATVFGPYPARMLMLNMTIEPLDGSPGITVPVQFTPNPALAQAFGSATPSETLNEGGDGNYSAVWMPANLADPTEYPGFSNTFNIGTLTVTIPTNANSMSAYAIHFDEASASPSGLLSFPNRTFTGLITLSSRTNSYYNDGIPDSWRLRYFGTIYNELSVSNADADGTGMDNWQKYLAGLNPVDPTSVLNEGTDQAVAQSQQDLVLYWPSVAGQTYIIERSPTLFPPQWTAISTNIGDGTYMEIHDTSGGNDRFYQVTTP